ncbi:MULTISPECIES: ParB/RepB/Spo0J family partition protein [Paenibacillus]|uniref:ParB/RepB/Spo0J family partition protein n=1 Tax=Paenibacillus residui TaxID=629724 RepID=A0ABW3DEV7_9BACL|nr:MULTISPECIES: ParB/RepB/Spo0J family partition protein [Paenibacillus]MBS5910706.1 ParB/RepB/Spo0J family partition protein [Paenibacillus macerans]MBU5443397.1 ParB/RepB/Spo0J family partition protein [Paenibacillus sp. MSJ-34]SHE11454.1 ParB family chromosome partioning protein [Chlamydia abortus]
MKENVTAIPIDQLYSFHENPYKVADNEELQALSESIKMYGVISPLVVRQRTEGGYEIISGHRRKAACEKAGIDIVPAFVREMDRYAAIIALVDSNLHREHVLPSEKAFAYKMKLEAIKAQRQRNDLVESATSDRIGHKSRECVAHDVGTSATQVQRFVRLTKLIPPILDMVDNGKIAFSPAVELSYLTEQEQTDLLETMESEDRTPSLSQAQRMKKLSTDGLLDMNVIFDIMTEEKANQKEQIKLKKESIKDFFPKGYTAQQMEKTILKLLEEWRKKRERSRHDAR